MKEHLFSVTQKDFDIQFYRGTGNGGQKKNKTSSACRITHKETGLQACCEEYREQPRNKQRAFEKLVKSDEFQKWLKLKSYEVMGKIKTQEEIESEVEASMCEENLKVEYLENRKG